MSAHTWHMEAQMVISNFFLLVDYFGFKYVGKEHAEHFITCIQKYHPVSVECIGELYCGVSLNLFYKINMLPYLFQYMWKVTCMNINTKYHHDPSMHHKNGKDQSKEPKLSRQPKIATYIYSHLKT